MRPVLREEIEAVCVDVLAYARAKAYTGYSKFDACNSPLVAALTFNRSFLRLLFTQAVMRSPINIRPLIGVRPGKNPKALALFAMATLNMYRTTGLAIFARDARNCLDWLIDHTSEHLGYAGPCWGYNFDWAAHPLFYAPRYMPNCVVTTFACEALLAGYNTFDDALYLHTAVGATRFLLQDLPVLYEDEQRKCIAYVPAIVKHKVVNINAMASAALAKIGKAADYPELIREARKLMRFVIDVRTPYDAWYYTYPSHGSPLRHDNYHTGGIIDALFDYMVSSGDDRWWDIYVSALRFYEETLFLENGAPKYQNHKPYPFDVHGSSQGIISFVKASAVERQHLKVACRIARWAIDNLYSGEGFFYHQKCRYFTKKFTLMRWCNAWMARALSELLEVMAPEKSG